MDKTEQMAADIALAMNGGEWKDGKWYSKGHRDAWINAVKPYADEIERLELDAALAVKRGFDLNDAYQELERLREDSKHFLKLANDARVALNLILNHPAHESKQWEVAVNEMKQLARAYFDGDK